MLLCPMGGLGFGAVLFSLVGWIEGVGVGCLAGRLVVAVLWKVGMAVGVVAGCLRWRVVEASAMVKRVGRRIQRHRQKNEVLKKARLWDLKDVLLVVRASCYSSWLR